MPVCHLQHVRCHVKLVQHHNSWLKRPDLAQCGHSAIETTRTISAGDPCWNDNSCNSKPTQNCHNPDSQGEIDLGNRLGDKKFKTIVVTHDRTNMERLGKFHCRRQGDACGCTCDKHPLCCTHKNKRLSNDAIFANSFASVATTQACCNMCTNHPMCRAWEFNSLGVCILKDGVPHFVENPSDAVTTWAGLRSNSTDHSGFSCDAHADPSAALIAPAEAAAP
jgi:hypothetical protein